MALLVLVAGAGATALVKGPCSGPTEGGRRVCNDPTTFCDTFENRWATKITLRKLKLTSGLIEKQQKTNLEVW